MHINSAANLHTNTHSWGTDIKECGIECHKEFFIHKKYRLCLPLVDLAHSSLGGLESIREETISSAHIALNP